MATKEQQKAPENKETMYLIRAYYSDPSDSWDDGIIRVTVNENRYLLHENKEEWVPEEVVNALKLTEQDVVTRFYDEETGKTVTKTVRRRRVNFEVIDKKRVTKVDANGKAKPDDELEDIVVDGEIVSI